jgi:MoxR-like ATPase
MDFPEEVLLTPKKIVDEVSKVIIGRKDMIELLTAALLSEGHVLIEGYPGTAKTMMAKSFAKTIQGTFKRIQFTPDTLPSDVTGFYIYTLDGRNIFRPGPIFANIVLADELNRATPRTQAALLEAMQERQATIEGETHTLPSPFMVIASQIPYGYAGTYPLTEVQLDRFTLRLWSGYPGKEDEEDVVSNIDFIESLPIDPIASTDEVLSVIEYVKKINVSSELVDYIVNIVDVVRNHPDIALAPSPRASIALFKCSRALALMDGREYVIPDDIKRLIHPVLDHRIRVNPEAELAGVKPEDIIDESVKKVSVPK